MAKKKPAKKPEKKPAKKSMTKSAAKKSSTKKSPSKAAAASGNGGGGMPSGPFVWHELMTSNVGSATSFYKNLFGWSTRPMNMANGMKYTIWQSNGQDVGGMMEIGGDWGPVPPHWMIYVGVPDVDDAADRAQRLGGKVSVPPTDIPDIGRFAILNDPAGAAIAVYTSAGQA